MKLRDIYHAAINKGIEADIRGKREIERILKRRKEEYSKLNKREKEYFDKDSLFNPFSDTRIINGNPDQKISSMIVGIDVDGDELLLVDRLKGKGKSIDLVVSHHPIGRAYANFYEVMDLQIDVFVKEGISLSVSQNLLERRKSQVARKVSSANHQCCVDVAKWLNISLLCLHTPCDNLAYQYIKKTWIRKNQQIWEK